MKKSEIKIRGVYVAKVSGQLVSVRIDRESHYGGWDATNLATGRAVRIRSAARLRGRIRAPKVANEKAREAREAALDAEDSLGVQEWLTAREAAVKAEAAVEKDSV